MNLKEVLEHFEVKSGPNGESGYYECFCPAHKDTHPSLLIKAVKVAYRSNASGTAGQRMFWRRSG